MNHFAVSAAASPDNQRALQAAIWRTEYGSNWQLDGVDNAKTGNSAVVMAAYTDYLTQLGSNSAPITSVLWISPNKDASQGNSPPNPFTSHYQGLVGFRVAAAAAPEPGTVALLLSSGLPFMGAVAARRRRRQQRRRKA